jgi:hypothetical protein
MKFSAALAIIVGPLTALFLLKASAATIPCETELGIIGFCVNLIGTDLENCNPDNGLEFELDFYRECPSRSVSHRMN